MKPTGRLLTAVTAVLASLMILSPAACMAADYVAGSCSGGGEHSGSAVQECSTLRPVAPAEDAADLRLQTAHSGIVLVGIADYRQSGEPGDVSGILLEELIKNGPAGSGR